MSYLDLVSDSDTADAFCGLLPLIIRGASLCFCGLPRQMVTAVSEQARDFERTVEIRCGRWMAKAYRRGQTMLAQKQATPEVAVKEPTVMTDGSGEQLVAGLAPGRRAGAVTGGRDQPKWALHTQWINAWITEEGYDNRELAAQLRISPRAVASLRHNGRFHGRPAVVKLAKLMGRDEADLYLP